MRVPLEWLRQYVRLPGDLPPVDLAHKLTMAGSEVVGIERTAEGAVLDLEITPNRPDCLSIIGIAREVAAITGAKLKLPRVVQGSRLKVQGQKLPRTSNLEPRTQLTVRIEDGAGCRHYVGRLFEGVAIGPSPEWMQRRLEACGLRPVNNIVDITNYVLLELGQPLHAFDADRLQKGMVVVRLAKPGETLVTLDVVPRVLEPEMLVIADASRPVAIAGVMGGLDMHVTNLTKRVVLESAYFEPLTIRRTARRLGLASESSYRFERGVDPAGVDRASRRAGELIRELAGGIERACEAAGKPKKTAVSITLTRDRLTSRLGIDVPPAAVHTLLQALGCAILRRGAGWIVTPPSFRPDLTQDVDLHEELARLWGYERIPNAIPHASIAAPRCSVSSYARALRLKQQCAGLGLSEAMTWSLLSAEEAAAFGFSGGVIEVTNPLSRDQAVLRPTLLHGLLRAAARNLSQGSGGARLFEFGQVFAWARAQERPVLGVALAGSWERGWRGETAADLFRLKGIMEQLAARCSHAAVQSEGASLPWAEPGQAIRLRIGDRPLGVIGEVASRLRECYNCAQPVWLGEVDAGALLTAPTAADCRAQDVSHFPPVKRDLSFVVDRKAAYGEIAGLIRSTGSPLASDIELIDRYAGHNIPEAKHSLTFSIEYRDPARTLTAEEVDRVHARIVSALTERFGIQLR